jgi:hypothetical protein
MDYNYENAIQEENRMNEKLNECMEKNGIGHFSSIDHDVDMKISTFLMSSFRIGRLYHKYFITVLYKYDRDVDDKDRELIDVLVYKCDSNGLFFRIQSYERYIRSLVVYFLPDYFSVYNIKYKLLYFSACYPFYHEDHHIISQNYLHGELYNNVPLHPIFKYFIISINGYTYVCYIHGMDQLLKRCGHFDLNGNRKTSYIKDASIIKCVLKEDYLDVNKGWMFLDDQLSIFYEQGKGRLYHSSLNDITLEKVVRCESIYTQ